jgi:hypothetical protein
MRRFASVAIVLLIAGCTAIRQQKAMPAKADNLEFHNLQVLSPNMTRDQLIETMRGFARALGTRCEHCHVQTASDPRPQFDFPSDAKPEKKVARTMILMVREINSGYIAKLPHGTDAPPNVTCGTCHRGHTTPEPYNPPAPPPNPAPAPQP